METRNKSYIVVTSWRNNTAVIKEAVSKFGDVIVLFENVILVNTTSRAIELRDALKKVLPGESQIYISKLSRGSAWSNVEVSNVSIKAFYRYE